MGMVAEGHLFLGWEVYVEDAENYDNEDWLINGAESVVYGILGKPWAKCDCYPVLSESIYYECEYIYVGLDLMNPLLCDNFDVEDYGQFLMSNAKLLKKTACEIYEAIIGRHPDTDPMLMCIGCEG